MSPSELINQDSGIVEYYTPANIIEAARATMGRIDLDPASSEAANQTVRASAFFGEAADGLSRAWFGRVWLNHPFGKKTNLVWIKKLMAEFHAGRCTEFCSITYIATSERWFQPLLPFLQCFLHPRTNYLLPDGSVKRGVCTGSVVTYGGPDPGAFRRNFGPLGCVK